MKNFLDWIKSFLGGPWHLLIEYLHIALPEVKVVLLTDLLKVADPIVADLQDQNLTGDEKRTQATTLIQSAAAKAGWDVGVALVHAAIELAVLKMKASQPTTPVAPEGNLPGGETVSPTAAK